MEASKRERFMLFGAVPVLAACVGGVVTVAAGHFFGSNVPSDAMIAVLRMEGVTVEQRLQLLEQVNLGTSRFYNFLSTGILLLIPTGGILWSWADRIRR